MAPSTSHRIIPLTLSLHSLFDHYRLFVYCNANTSDHAEWTISAALLDLHDPRRVLAVTEEPLLHPETKAELDGVVKNATFPTGAVVVGDELYVYYGSGDLECCLATCNFNELLGYLKSQSRPRLVWVHPH